MATPVNQVFTVGHEAREEKVYAAEKNIASVRCAVVAFNLLVYIFLYDNSGSIPWLAYSIIVTSSLYSLFILINEPYKHHPLFLTSYSTYGTDALFITLWIWATGGFDSPFYLLFYISLIAVSFRFSAKTIWLTAFLYALCYIFLLVALGDIYNNLRDTIVRVGYIFCTAFFGADDFRRNITADAAEKADA